MRKKRVISTSCFSIIVCVILLLCSIPVFAAGNLAVSAGKNFGDGVDTRADAETATSAHKVAGYNTKTFTNPIKSNFTTAVLKADILFFSGHGNADTLSFGTLKFKCQSGTVDSNHINLWNTAKNQKINNICRV